MGPAERSMILSVPQRPRFSWDMRSVPWTDGVGNQQEYALSVKAWSNFHNNLPDGNSNKIADANKGILLQSNLYGRAKDLCRGLDDTIIASADGAALIVETIYKKDPLSVTSSVFDELNKLLSLRRETSESFPDYEMRFAAQLSRFNALGESSSLSGAISALMLLRNAATDASQRISILAAASPKTSDFSNTSSTDEYLDAIEYETIASVLRQCELPHRRHDHDGLHASMGHTGGPAPQRPFRGGRRSGRGGNGNQRQIRLTREQVQLAKNTSQCKKCGQYCHWYGDHNPDGTLKPGVLSSPTPIHATPAASSDPNTNEGTVADPRRNTIHFSMARLSSSPTSSPDVLYCSAAQPRNINYIGPLVDSGAPYSAIGLTELRSLARTIAPGWDGKLGPLPESVRNRPYWQYGRDTHASDARPILGAVNLCAFADDQSPVIVTHLVLEGSSQWVIGQNVTRHCNICSVGQSRLEIPAQPNNGHSRMLCLPIVYHDMLQYLPSSLFSYPVLSAHTVTTRSHISRQRNAPTSTNNPDSSASALNSPATPAAQLSSSTTPSETAPLAEINTSVPGQEREPAAPPAVYLDSPSEKVSQRWKLLKPIVDRVHRHICGHADFGDIRLLLERNKMWNDDVARYLKGVTARCGACRAAQKPPASRTVSLSALSRAFNDTVCIDHMYLEENRILHVMDASTRYSAGIIVDSLDLDSSIVAFETVWLTPFWAPLSIYGDQAFAHEKFKEHIQQVGSQFCPIPARRHSRNVLESKHGVIRSIYLRLRHDSPSANREVLVARALAVSNDLCGSDLLSAYEMARGFTRPVISSSAAEARPVSSELLEAQTTLLAKRKLLRIMRSKTVKEPSIASGDMVEVFIKSPAHKRGKWTSPRVVLSFDPTSWTVTVPGAKGRSIVAAIEDVRPAIVEDTIAAMVREADDELESLIDDLKSSAEAEATDVPDDPLSHIDHNAAWLPTNHRNNEVSFFATDPLHDDGTMDDDVLPQPNDRIEVFWPLDNSFYPGTVSTTSGKDATIKYEDGNEEVLHMPKETWRFASSATLSALSAHAPCVESSEPQVLDSMMEHFGCKPFLLHNAQGFPGFPLTKAYEREENAFTKTVKRVDLGSVPVDANIITSHTLYKIKQDDSGKLSMKARIAPHGNEDSAKLDMRSDCASCAPFGVRTLLSVAVIRSWRLTKIDVSSAFLQTGAAERDVYVVPPRESKDHGHCLWLLLTAAYGLVNANAKFQVQADATLKALGLLQVHAIPQLFTLTSGKSLEMIVAKIVDDILIAGKDPVVDEFVAHFDAKFKLGTVARGPGLMRFFGLNISQRDDRSITIDGDDKLRAIEAHPISRLRRRQGMDPLNELELRAFRSVNCSIGWLGNTVSPFCAHFNSRMQQLAPKACIKELVEQANALREIKEFGTTSVFEKPTAGTHELSMICYSDTGRECEAAQLAFVIGLVLGPLQQGSIIHTLAWQSRKSQRPVRSVGAAEILACGDGIIFGKMMSAAMSELLGIRVPLVVLIDSKDLFDSLSTQRNSVDRSIRADVAVIRHEFETGSVETFTWIPGKENVADAGTKRDSPLRDALRLMLATGKLPMSHMSALQRSTDRPLG